MRLQVRCLYDTRCLFVTGHIVNECNVSVHTWRTSHTLN